MRSMNRVGPVVLPMMALALLMSLLLTGCGASPNTQPQPPAMDEAALQAIVRQAVQDAAPAPQPAPMSQAETQPDEEALRSIVREAVQDAAPAPEPAPMSQAEMQQMVEDAVMASMDSRDTPLSAEEIERVVQSAVSEASSENVTRAELEEAISGALDEAIPGELVIYSGRSQTLVDAVIQQFSQATGVEVKVKYGGTSQLAATLLEEGQNSPADIFFAQDPGGLGAVESLLAELPQEVLDRVPSWARSSQGKWVGLSGRARVLVYNPETLSEQDLPDDIFGLTDPKWKGRLGWAPTNASFQTMVTAMRTVWGEDKTRRWLEGIMANEPRMYPKNTPQVAAAAAGEIDVGMVNHYYLFRFLAEEGEAFPARNYHPRAGGPGSTVMVAGAGILDTSENRATAKKFLEFMLSTVGQQYFAGQTFEYPLVEGIKTPHVLTPLADINHPNIALKDLADLAATQDLLRDTGVLP